LNDGLPSSWDPNALMPLPYGLPDLAGGKVSLEQLLGQAGPYRFVDVQLIPAHTDITGFGEGQ
jgi:hypothetical protein